MLYSVQPSDRISLKGYGLLPFAKNIGKSIGKNISINLSGKCSQKRLDHAKPSATDALKTTSKRVIQKLAEATGDLIGNKSFDRITKASKTLRQNNSEAIKERYLKKDMYLPKKDKKLLMN